MEDIVVHSKNFLIRWVHAEHGGRISWRVVPVKRSINFNVFARSFDGLDSRAVSKTFSQAPGSLTERLDALGFKPISSSSQLVRIDSKTGTEESAELSGNQLVAFVFDNTFSVSYSKHVEFTFSVEPPVIDEHQPQHMHHQLTSVAASLDQKRVLAAAAANAALYKPDPAAPDYGRQPEIRFRSSVNNLQSTQTPPNSNGSPKTSPTNGTASPSPDSRNNSLKSVTSAHSGPAGPFPNPATAVAPVNPTDPYQVRLRSGSAGNSSTTSLSPSINSTRSSRSGSSSGLTKVPSRSVSTSSIDRKPNLQNIKDHLASLDHNSTTSLNSQKSANNVSENAPISPKSSNSGSTLQTTPNMQTAQLRDDSGSPTPRNSVAPADDTDSDVFPSSALTGPQIHRQSSIPNSSTDLHSESSASLATSPSSASISSSAFRRHQSDAQSSIRGRQNTVSSIQSRSDLESLSNRSLRHRSTLPEGELSVSADGRVVTGYLQKKRRKQFQGFAKRYFSLDRKTGLLNYYLNNRSSSLRGVMPVKIADMTVTSKNLIISLDSGMETWTLKAHDKAAFDAWRAEFNALRSREAETDSDESERTTRVGLSNSESTDQLTFNTYMKPAQSEHELLEIKMAAASLPESKQKHELLYILNSLTLPANHHHSPHHHHPTKTHRDLIVKKSHAFTHPLNVSLIPPTRISASHQSALKELVKEYLFVVFVVVISSPDKIKRFVHVPVLSFILLLTKRVLDIGSFKDILRFLSSKPSITDLKEVLLHIRPELQPLSPVGTEDENDTSDEDDEAKEDIEYVPQTLAQESDKPVDAEIVNPENAETNGESKVSETKEDQPIQEPKPVQPDLSAATSLYPLPHGLITRRKQIIGPKEAPPSLMALLKQAKDPHNQGAPVTANEPLSALEYTAEMMENYDLLNAASQSPKKSAHRMLLVATFAVSRIAGTRCRERSLRKPFTPLLGETFELVREDANFRFMSEKVSHKPEVFATQAESPLWTLHFTSRPHTKMWPKTVQLTDVGHVSVAFPDGERVSFLNPELFLRNLYVGDRYVEPSGSVLVESSLGKQASIDFKGGGMFSGRSEEVKLSCDGTVYEGKWTDKISFGSKTIWTAKPLVDNAKDHYGWPLFAAQLNETTVLEKDCLPPNDSRLRPDLLCYEKQDLNKAQKLKLLLEQEQRKRRAVMASKRKTHEPMFFVKSKDATGNYVLMRGEKNYWVRRKQGNWDGIPDFFKV